LKYKTVHTAGLGFVLFLQLLISGIAFSQTKFAIEDLIRLHYPNRLTTAPDGSHLAFETRTENRQTNQYQRQIWYTPTIPFAPVKISGQFEQAFLPQWSPVDLNLLAFLAIPSEDTTRPGGNKNRPNQLYLLNVTNSTPAPVTQTPGGVEMFIWSPTGTTLAYLTRQPATELLQPGFDAVRFDTPVFPKAIWLYDLTTQINEKIFTGDFGIRDLAFSPDGELLVFSTNYSGLASDPNIDLWLLSPGSGEAFAFTQVPGEENNPQFSADGQKIAFLGALDSLTEFPQTDLFLAPLANGAVKNLTETFDFPIAEFCWVGAKIWFLAQQRTEQRLFEIDPASEKIVPVLKKNPDGWFSQLTRTRQPLPLFLIGESATRLPEIFRLESNRELTQLSHFSDSLKTFQIRAPEKITWPAPDGKAIEGWFYAPTTGLPPYPTIVALHGGPFGAFRNKLVQNDDLLLFAQHGYAVFAPNPSGSAGYGHAFAREVISQIGKLDSPQILAGVDYLIAQNRIDSTRLGIMGGSYGGYLVNWIIAHTSRFQAAASLYGIFDLAHDWGTSSQPVWQQIYLRDYFWTNPGLYRELSPSGYIRQIHTPLLLLHGEEDEITDATNSKLMYRALKTLGRDVELVIYPRENHGIQHEPKHEIDKIHRLLDWFDRYLTK